MAGPFFIRRFSKCIPCGGTGRIHFGDPAHPHSAVPREFVCPECRSGVVSNDISEGVAQCDPLAELPFMRKITGAARCQGDRFSRHPPLEGPCTGWADAVHPECSNCRRPMHVSEQPIWPPTSRIDPLEREHERPQRRTIIVPFGGEERAMTPDEARGLILRIQAALDSGPAC